ncbi:hypothetical protein [Bifidobacterium catulorum]|uniref:hypothetical protein n=1 Tax=Bifidobacterium catulorum TaxID=1630173 RepID=UPI001304B987|nr:hypothetical protein [Bifidobacterium catulorum]
MKTNPQGPQGGSSRFTIIATASAVVLAGQMSSTFAWVAYMAVLAYAAVADWRERR